MPLSSKGRMEERRASRSCELGRRYTGALGQAQITAPWTVRAWMLLLSVMRMCASTKTKEIQRQRHRIRYRCGSALCEL